MTGVAEGQKLDATIDNSSPEIIYEVPGRPAYSEDGVDLTLIRWSLSLSPAERLRMLRRRAASLERMRDARARRAVRHSGDPAPAQR